MEPTAAKKPFYRSLYFQVITAIVIGVALGHLYPETGEAMKPLGDGFIKLVKMMIAPIIFCTVVHGIASIADLRRVGRVGLGRGGVEGEARQRRAHAGRVAGGARGAQQTGTRMLALPHTHRVVCKRQRSRDGVIGAHDIALGVLA